MADSPIPDALFIRTWNSCTRLAEVAKALGISPSTASYRASKLRGDGVPLPRYLHTKGYRDESIALTEGDALRIDRLIPAIAQSRSIEEWPTRIDVLRAALDALEGKY
jgi:DNA-binding Lrp family transcriptional regulator